VKNGSGCRSGRGGPTPRKLSPSARIVLECAAGLSNTVVAGKLGITHQTVGKWRQRFLEWRVRWMKRGPAHRAESMTRRSSGSCA
jgi:hypothetical protein